MGTAMLRLHTIFLIASLLLLQPAKDVGVLGHGRLMDPPSRNSMWRLGFSNPVNYNDNELYCGGYSVQWSQNGGKCGVCGDAYHIHPRPHEVGGQYANGIIVRTYSSGQIIDIQIELTANHQGFFEVKLCPNNNPKREATQECFDKHPLYLAGTNNPIFMIPTNSERRETFNYKVELPPYVTCTQCVIQWTYTTANTWGMCPNGTEAIGCGNAETFRNCADVRIVTSFGGLPPNAIPTNYRLNNYRVAHAMDNRLRYQVCVPTEHQRRREGMEDWCILNCFHDTPHCPASHCLCPENCDPIGDIAGKPGAEAYCLDKCIAYKADCPRDRCHCY